MTFFKKLWNILEAIVRFFLLKVFRLKLSEEQIQAFLQFVKFGLIGVTSTVISYVLYLVSLLALQKVGCSPKYDYLIAQIIAFVLSVLWSYFWNNRLVFKKDENETRSFWKSLLKCYASYAFTGLFLNTILSYLWVDVIGISKLIAPIINLLVSVPINFFMNKLWAFKTDKKNADANS
ncbi:MAG: GtrA family protein [Lachnospiraceae bacterium]|nr:GtrA family protein [Lachnospiraceae bacterium]